MRSPPVLSDAEAEARAEHARAEGADIVRNHLSRHLETNHGRSADYVTWISTLHPENAQVTIDERFLIPGNPWWTIYEQAKADVPTVVVAEVQEESKYDEESNVGARPTPPQPHYLCVCSPITTLVGSMIALGAILGVLITELMAFCFYIVEFLFFWIAHVFDPNNLFTRLFYSIFMLVYAVCSMADSICLLASVLVTEVLAGACWLVSVLFAGILVANHWHQYIRWICHVIRWAFRSPFETPPRHFALLCMEFPAKNPSSDEALPQAERIESTEHAFEEVHVTAYEVQTDAEVPSGSGKSGKDFPH